jgi:hypothetical protein
MRNDATEELGQRLAGLRLISLDLDHDRWTPSSSVAEFFWHLRSRLWEAKPRGTGGGAGIETPLFDFLYFEARARLLGKEHPETLTSMNNLAQTLYAQGDPAGDAISRSKCSRPWLGCWVRSTRTR